MVIFVLGDPMMPQWRLLDRLPGPVETVIGTSFEVFRDRAPDAEVILRFHDDDHVLPRLLPLAPNLKWVHSLSAGIEEALSQELIESPVALTNARGVYARSLAEFALGAMLYFAKDFRRMIRQQQAGVWEEFDVEEIHGRTLGILGYGSLGRAAAQNARALGMRVIATRRRPELSAGDPLLDSVLPLERRLELFAGSDYVLLSAPLTPRTRGLAGASELGAMRRHAVLINIGRGAVADEAALIAALTEGGIRGAALDVFAEEPLPAGHPFWGMENVLLSPHSADHTPTWIEDSIEVFLANFERYRNGEPLLNLADKREGY